MYLLLLVSFYGDTQENKRLRLLSSPNQRDSVLILDLHFAQMSQLYRYPAMFFVEGPNSPVQENV